MKKIFLLILFFILINIVNAENESINSTNTNITLNITNITRFHDLKLQTNIDDEINIETNYNKFFKITYLNHTKGEKEEVLVFVYYNITKENMTLKENVFNVTVNSYTTSKTGEYYFNETGNFTVCGEIISSAVNESNFANNKACKNFTVISTFNVSCNISLTIETEKLIYESGEKISFKNKLNNDSFNYRIEYWVEDLFGKIFKKRYETSNLNKKSYTPKIKTKVEVLKIIANISYLACNDSNKSDNYFETLIIVKGEPNKKEECEICECEDEEETEKKKTGKTEIEFVEIPKEVIVGEEFNLKILIKNNDDEKHEYDVYSYIYRGSKCYSQSRENNKISVKIKAFDEETVELKDRIEEAGDGEYNIKVKVKQDNLKTEKELKESTEIKNIEQEKESKTEESEILETVDSETNINEFEIEENIETFKDEIILEEINFDYESSSEKSKKLIKYFILTTLTLIVIIIILKNGPERDK